MEPTFRPTGRKGRGVRPNAFSVLEVLVGIVIASVLFIPLSRLMVTGAHATRYTEDYLRAMTIAKGQIEMFRHAAKINKYAMEELITRYMTTKGFKPFDVDGRYHVELDVDPQFSTTELPDLRFGDGAPTGLKAKLLRVSVKVSWKISGEPRQLELEALIDRVYK